MTLFKLISKLTLQGIAVEFVDRSHGRGMQEIMLRHYETQTRVRVAMSMHDELYAMRDVESHMVLQIQAAAIRLAEAVEAKL